MLLLNTESEELKVLGCAESVASKVKGIMAGSLPTVLVIVLIVSIGLCCWKKRRRGVERGFTQIQPTQEPDPGKFQSTYVVYDVILIFKIDNTDNNKH